MDRDPYVVAVSVATAATLGLVLVVHFGIRLGVLPAALTAYLTRLVYGLTNYHFTQSQSNDGRQYDLDAQTIVLAWRGEAPTPRMVDGKEGWSYLLAFIYRFFGHVPEIGVVINALAGALTLIVVVAVCRRVSWDPAVQPAAWIVALWPVGLLWGPLLLREAIVTLLLATAMYGAVVMRLGRGLAGAAILAGSGLLMIWMRGGLAYLILVGLPVLLGVSVATSGGNRSKRGKALMLGVAIMAVATPLAASQLSRVTYFDLDKASRTADALNYGSTGFSAAGAVAANPAVAFLFTSFGPLPYQWHNFGLLAAGIDALLWITLWVLAIVGARAARENRWFIPMCVVPPFALFAYVSLSGTNFGLIMRFRGLGLPFVAPLAALGLGHLLIRRRTARSSGDHKRVTPRDGRGRPRTDHRPPVVGGPSAVSEHPQPSRPRRQPPLPVGSRTPLEATSVVGIPEQ